MHDKWFDLMMMTKGIGQGTVVMKQTDMNTTTKKAMTMNPPMVPTNLNQAPNLVITSTTTISNVIINPCTRAWSSVYALDSAVFNKTNKTFEDVMVGQP